MEKTTKSKQTLLESNQWRIFNQKDVCISLFKEITSEIHKFLPLADQLKTAQTLKKVHYSKSKNFGIVEYMNTSQPINKNITQQRNNKENDITSNLKRKNKKQISLKIHNIEHEIKRKIIFQKQLMLITQILEKLTITNKKFSLCRSKNEMAKENIKEIYILMSEIQLVLDLFCLFFQERKKMFPLSFQILRQSKSSLVKSAHLSQANIKSKVENNNIDQFLSQIKDLREKLLQQKIQTNLNDNNYHVKNLSAEITRPSTSTYTQNNSAANLPNYNQSIRQRNKKQAQRSKHQSLHQNKIKNIGINGYKPKDIGIQIFRRTQNNVVNQQINDQDSSITDNIPNNSQYEQVLQSKCKNLVKTHSCQNIEQYNHQNVMIYRKNSKKVKTDNLQRSSLHNNKQDIPQKTKQKLLSGNSNSQIIKKAGRKIRTDQIELGSVYASQKRQGSKLYQQQECNPVKKEVQGRNTVTIEQKLINFEGQKTKKQQKMPDHYIHSLLHFDNIKTQPLHMQRVTKQIKKQEKDKQKGLELNHIKFGQQDYQETINLQNNSEQLLESLMLKINGFNYEKICSKDRIGSVSSQKLIKSLRNQNIDQNQVNEKQRQMIEYQYPTSIYSNNTIFSSGNINILAKGDQMKNKVFKNKLKKGVLKSKNVLNNNLLKMKNIEAQLKQKQREVKISKNKSAKSINGSDNNRKSGLGSDEKDFDIGNDLILKKSTSNSRGTNKSLFHGNEQYFKKRHSRKMPTKLMRKMKYSTDLTKQREKHDKYIKEWNEEQQKPAHNKYRQQYLFQEIQSQVQYCSDQQIEELKQTKRRRPHHHHRSQQNEGFVSLANQQQLNTEQIKKNDLAISQQNILLQIQSIQKGLKSNIPENYSSNLYMEQQNLKFLVQKTIKDCFLQSGKEQQTLSVFRIPYSESYNRINNIKLFERQYLFKADNQWILSHYKGQTQIQQKDINQIVTSHALYNKNG